MKDLSCYKNLAQNLFIIKCYTLFNPIMFTPEGYIAPCFMILPDIKTEKITNSNMYNVLNSPVMIKLRKQVLSYEGLSEWSCSLNPKCRFANIFDNYFNYIKEFQEFKHDKDIIIKPEDVTRLVVDFSTHCQLKCSPCWTRGNCFNEYRNIRPNHMHPSTLKNIINQLPSLKLVHVAKDGESLLNPWFSELLAMLSKYEVNLISANLNYLLKDHIYSILNSNVNLLVVSIDGASQETYSKYRIGGDFDKVVENIKRINYYKNNQLKLRWQFVLFDFNLHEVDKAAKMAEDLGMDFSVRENNTKTFNIKDDIYTEQQYEKINRYLNIYNSFPILIS